VADSIRESILANIQTTLRTIAVVGGYNFTVASANVRRVVGGIGTVQEYPTLFIVAGEQQIVPEGTAILGKASWFFSVSIEGWLRADRDTIPTHIERLAADIHKAMLVDYTRGGYAIDTRPQAWTAPTVTDAEEQRAGIGLTFQVYYRHQWATPFTA
jgi:hypothetical protein